MDRNKNSKRQVRNEKYSSMNYNNLYDENLYKRMRLKSFREEERKKQRRKQKRQNRVTLILGILILIVALLIAITVFFRMSEIDVSGNDRIEKEKIINLVIDNGKVGNIKINNTLFVYAVYKLGLDKKPKYIDDIDIEIKGLDKIKVIVKEKEIIGYAEKNNNYFLLDKEGTILDVYEVLPEDMIKIEGLKIKSTKKYSNIKEDNNTIFEYLNIIGDYSKKEKLDISVINIEDVNNIKINIGNKVIILGNSHLLETKLSKIKEMIKELGDMAGELHLEYYNEENDIVTFNNYS